MAEVLETEKFIKKAEEVSKFYRHFSIIKDSIQKSFADNHPSYYAEEIGQDVLLASIFNPFYDPSYFINFVIQKRVREEPFFKNVYYVFVDLFDSKDYLPANYKK